MLEAVGGKASSETPTSQRDRSIARATSTLNRTWSSDMIDRNARTQSWKRARPWHDPNFKPEIDPEIVWKLPSAEDQNGRETVEQLRSMLLDEFPRNTMPPHKTRSALKKTLKSFNKSHMSYDLDSDGVVSISDYKLAREMDVDGSGIIDDEEKVLGRMKLAREYYESQNALTSRHHKVRHSVVRDRARNLVNNAEFGSAFQKLQRQLWIRQGRGGKAVIDSLDYASVKPKDRFAGKQPNIAIKSARSGNMRQCTSAANLRRHRKDKFAAETEEIRQNISKQNPDFKIPRNVRYGRSNFITDMSRLNLNNVADTIPARRKALSTARRRKIRVRTGGIAKTSEMSASFKGLPGRPAKIMRPRARSALFPDTVRK